MIKVEFFGNYMLEFKTSEIDIQANTINEMLKIVCNKFPQMDSKHIMSASLFLNDKPLNGLFIGRKKLKDGDRILMMYPSAGG